MTPWSISSINNYESSMFDGIMTAWSFTVRFFFKNFGTSLMVMPFRYHCIGHKRIFFKEGIIMA